MRMPTTYIFASRVIAWMGANESHLTEELAELLATYLRNTEILRPSTHHVEAIEIILSKRYWTGLWIVQELYNALYVTFMCGNHIFDRRSIEIFMQQLRQTEENAALYWRAPDWFRGLIEARMTTTSNKVLLEIVHDFGHLNCERKHDKIYALLGLATDTITVDYSVSLFRLAFTVLQNAYTHPQWVADRGYRGLTLYVEKLIKYLGLQISALHQDIFISVALGEIDSEKSFVDRLPQMRIWRRSAGILLAIAILLFGHNASKPSHLVAIELLCSSIATVIQT
jgi:hypothetical protein